MAQKHLQTGHPPARLKLFRENLALCLLFFLPPLVLFWQVTMGDQTMLPVDNLFAYEPFYSDANELGIHRPHNPLVSDLILQNYLWRRQILLSFKQGELPLWNPYLFSGTPFLAKGQHLALYPLSVIFFIFPLWKAYGVFTVVHLGMAGWFAFVLARQLGLRGFEATITGFCYALSGFMLAQCVFPMILATAAWFPLILAAVWKMTPEQRETQPFSAHWICIGAVALGMQGLAGHAEILYYTLLTALFLALWRMIASRNSGTVRRQAIAIVSFITLGLLLASVQLVPQYEVLRDSFRSQSASFSEVRSWAFPLRQLIVILISDFFGNPTHYDYTHLVTGEQIVSDTPVFWGIKNYVEGSIYPGILTLMFSFLALLRIRQTQKRKSGGNKIPFIFLILLLLSLSFAFGTPLYALIYYLPGMEQVHSSFRWMMVATLCLSILAGYGCRALTGEESRTKDRQNNSMTARISQSAFWGGVGIIITVFLSRVFFRSFEPWISMALRHVESANRIFPSAEHFYSYQFPGLLRLGVLAALSGLVLGLHPLARPSNRIFFWRLLILLSLIVDLLYSFCGFYPVNNPALLEYEPPVVRYLKQDTTHWRLSTFDPEDKKTFNANLGWLYGFEDIRGYDSIFSMSYADYMQCLGEQDQLQYNRIAPLRNRDSLNSPLLDILNVKYVLTEEVIESPKWECEYQDDSIRVYRNREVMPRAFLLPVRATVVSAHPWDALKQYNPRTHVILESGMVGNCFSGKFPPEPGNHEAAIIQYEHHRIEIEAEIEETSWLVLGDCHAPGWKAFGKDLANDETAQTLAVYRVNGILRGVILSPGHWKIVFEYRPASLWYGLAFTILGIVGVLALALLIPFIAYREKSDCVVD